MACLRPFVGKSHGKPRVDDRCVLRSIILHQLQWLAVVRRIQGIWSGQDPVQLLEALEVSG